MLTEESEADLLEKASAKEEAYNWVEAAKLYEQVAKSFLDKEMVKKAAETYKMLGYANERAAETVDTAKDYLEQNQYAANAYRKASDLFKQSGNISEELECDAEILYVNGLVTGSVIEAKKIFSQSYELFIKSSDLFSKNDDRESLARTLGRAALISWYILTYSSEQKELEQISQKRINVAEKALKLSREVGNLQAIIDSLNAWFWLKHGVPFSIGPYKLDKRRKEEIKKDLLLLNEILRSTKDYKNNRVLGWIYYHVGAAYCHLGWRFAEDEKEEREFIDKSQKILEKGLVCARNVKDKPLIILTIYWLEYFAIKSGRYKYVQKRILNDINEIEELKKIYTGLNHIWCYFAEDLLGTYYANMARQIFFTPAQRKIYTEKAIEYFNKTLKNIAFGPFYVNVYLNLTYLYSNLATLVAEKDDQEKYINKMLQYAKQAEKLAEKYEGGLARADGFNSQYIAYKTCANITESNEERIKLLSNAIDAAKKRIEYSVKSKMVIITYRMDLGLLFIELGICSGEKKPLIQARDLFLRIIRETMEKDYYHLTAATHEYIAHIEDRLGNHFASAENYEKAQKAHTESLKNIEYKPLKDLVKEKIEYAQAWNQIEKAKGYHKMENHLKAKKSYEIASEILKNLPKYNYETAYYTAWALLEEAEHLSKQERQEDAIERYKATKTNFSITVKMLQKASKRAKEKEERKRLEKLEKVAKLRVNYCSARIDLEKARILGKQGEHLEAAEKFASAASQFRDVCTVFKIERERRELEAIYYLCRAWETMEFAEKYEEPERFVEASGLFTKASIFFTDTNLKLLASSNSAFCQALEYGCRFDESTEIELKAQLYPKVKSMLRKAASLYEKGGFENGADWALATSTYFDGTWNLIRADEELELDEKGKLLGIGSRYLKSAAELFSNAGYKDKEIEIQNRLNRLEKEEKILVSALGTITKPTISGSTTGIVAPTCPLETSQPPRMSEINEITEESRRVWGMRAEFYECDPTLSILHMSDIQEGRFGIKEDILKGKELYYNYLIDLKSQLEIIHRKNKIDFVVISGDLASTGSKEEYEKLTNEFIPILNDVFLKGKKEVPKTRWIIVPGNHDVEWEKQNARFNNFIQFCQENGFHSYNLNNPESIYSKFICIEKSTGNTFGIIGINTCLDILDENSRNESSISNSYYSVFSKNWEEDFREMPKLMICHHTLHTIKRDKFDHGLNTLRDNNVLLALSGDIHKSESYADEISKIKCIPAGTISASKFERQVGIDEVSRQFNLINLNLQSGYVKWYTYIFEGTWRKIKNESFYLEHPSFSKKI